MVNLYNDASVFHYFMSIIQVQYMALRDTNGNFVSADSSNMLGELHQEHIPEERVCFVCQRP